MAGLFEIIQYEVQVCQVGHWHVRMRHPRSDREHAFTEARRIDLNEGVPARVVRDVYDPQTGHSQETVIFMSDRAKALGLRPAAAAPRPRSGARSTGKSASARFNTKPAPLAFRVTMAVGASLVTALLITSIATWLLSPQPESFARVLTHTPAPGTSTSIFVTVMLFSIFTMLRGPLGISRLARALTAMLETDEEAADDAPRPRAQPHLLRGLAPVQQPPELDLAPEPEPDQSGHLLSLARVMLARFFAEAAPANAAKAVEDTLGRRGLALYLAGAVSELAAHLEMPSPGDLLAQISPPLLQVAAKDVLAEARALNKADASLMAAGRTEMHKYVSVTDERPSMASALVAWHKAVRTELQEKPALQRDARAS